jgi:hypothetical protein
MMKHQNFLNELYHHLMVLF